jgi:ABC-2 type transport system ATP-binding protein
MTTYALPSAPAASPQQNPAATPMIELQGASRWFGQVIGLNDATCRIGPGLTALLGPNGAGKSTLLKLITGQIKPDTGSVKVLGGSPFANGPVLRQLGYCPENDSFYEDLSGREFVTLMASLSGFRGDELRTRVTNVLETVGMTDRCDRKIAGYSKGMRQRIKIAQGIVHDPQVLVLDEPLNGLDPPGRREITDLMMRFAAQGRCVLIASHILSEVEQLTHNILLMQRGRILARGSLKDIRAELDRNNDTPRHIRLRLMGSARPFAAALLSEPSVLALRLDPEDPNAVEVETRQPGEFYSRLPALILSNEWEVESLRSPDDHLESIVRLLLSRK